MPVFQKLNREERIHRPKSNNQYKYDLPFHIGDKAMLLFFFFPNIRIAVFSPKLVKVPTILIFMQKQNKRISNSRI